MKIERESITFLEELSRSPLSFRRESSPSVLIDMSINSDNSVSDDDFDGVDSDAETDEGRLSRSLQTWMTDHVWSNVHPREKLPPEPLYSGKLGQETKYLKERYARYYKSRSSQKKTSNYKEQKNGLRRTDSDDSITTHLSLLTCSSYGSDVKQVKIEPIREKRRRKRENASRASNSTSDACISETSPWIRLALASQQSSILSRFNRTHAALATTYMVAGDDDEYESEAFRLMDKDEQEALMKTGYRPGIIYIDKNKLQRSNSVSSIKKTSPPATIRRVLSGNAKKSRGKPLDIAELKRERLQRLAMEEAARKQAEREKEMRKRRKISLGTKRVLSNKSLRSQINTGRPGSPSGTSAISASAHSVQSTKSVLSTGVSTTASTSGKSSDMRPYSPSEPQSEPEEEEQLTVWKGDRQILEIDLRRELTQKVKRKIESTTKALKRCSGLGDGNEQKTQVGVHEEFPKHVEDDYSHKPRIIQRMRISPHLSGVISDDIKVRMGRPRYHEIRINDLEQWNKGFILNRSHRNLKVFNWLQSLKEDDFIKNVLSEIDDSLPKEEAIDLELYHVESADEPDVKPLYRAYEVRIL